MQQIIIWVQGISSLLNDQKGIISSLLPAGLSLASLNIGDWAKGKFDNDLCYKNACC
jgi:hypothetical protein